MKKPGIKTILVPIDFSKLSGMAIETATDLARRFDAAIHLVHVHEFYYPPGLLAPVPMSVATYRDDAATRRARRLRMLARKNGLAAENCHFMDGAPTFQEICKLARQIAADLIVMPTHGYTGIARFFGGYGGTHRAAFALPRPGRAGSRQEIAPRFCAGKDEH